MSTSSISAARLQEAAEQIHSFAKYQRQLLTQLIGNITLDSAASLRPLQRPQQLQSPNIGASPSKSSVRTTPQKSHTQNQNVAPTNNNSSPGKPIHRTTPQKPLQLLSSNVLAEAQSPVKTTKTVITTQSTTQLTQSQLQQHQHHQVLQPIQQVHIPYQIQQAQHEAQAQALAQQEKEKAQLRMQAEADRAAAEKQAAFQAVIERQKAAHPHVPIWALPASIHEALQNQATDPEAIFAPISGACDLDAIFNTGWHRRARTSSANWTHDQFTADEDDDYKQDMGYKPKENKEDKGAKEDDNNGNGCIAN
eukprot:TRINITY_DN60909_c0_g1_i1.p1 TRINITY_DN60909_c0_g1~~TRINITY_DN60909_c0_g1_i1.p1  ORF type:complete len:308 (+),score=44.23 TRINITY_DN60909_c0_g1_i1:108-1031(+)